MANSELKSYFVELDIIRKNFANTDSAKFKGKLQIICNNFGIIKSWNILFDEVWIDLYTTKSWFDKKTTLFNIRTKLFNELNIGNQLLRPTQSSNKIIKLTNQQIAILNNFFNNREKYNSSIKSIVGVLKGNNPGGEAKKPTSAEMIIDSEKTNIKNFVILLDDLMNFELFDFDACKIGSEKIEFIEYVNLNSDLKAAFDYMQKEKQTDSFIQYLINIKSYNKKYNEFSRKGDEIAKRERTKYSINIKKYYKENNIQLPFGFSINDNSMYQMCHIFEYKDLKDLLINALFNGDKNGVEKYKKMISDYENFIPLPEHVHRKFDRNYFTYNADGELITINNLGNDFINTYRDSIEKYKRINKEFLSNRKIEYIKKRNELINI